MPDELTTEEARAEARSRSVLETVKQAREPIAAFVLLVVAVNLALGIANVVLPHDGLSLLKRMKSEGGRALGLISLLVTLAAAGGCVLVSPATKHARIIALIGAGLAALATIFAAVNLVGGLIDGHQVAVAAVLEGLGGLLDLGLKGLAAWLLFLLARKMPQWSDLAPPKPSVEELIAATEEAPAWTPREAAGVRWNSAREAAAGYVAPTRPHGPTAGELAAGPSAAPAAPEPSADDVLTGPAAQASADLWKPRG